MKGVHIPNPYPMSDTHTLSIAALPEQVVLPIFDAEAVVSVGDSVKVGEVIAKGVPYVHASISGEVIAIDEEHIPHSSGLPVLCITIKGNGEDEHISYPYLSDYRKLSPVELLERLHTSGIVGLGGAGFATDIKIQSLQQCHSIIINATECEPAVEADNALMQNYPREILRGVEILLYMTGAKQAIVAIEDDKQEAFENMMLFNQNDKITITQVPTIYTSGAEKILIKNILGVEIPPREFATAHGILCQNVATVKAISDFILLGKPLIERIVTITGDNETPHNIVARVGTSLRNLTQPHGHLRTGGMMMGIDLPHSDYPLLKTTNAVFNTAEHTKPPATDCIRCGRCAEVCPEYLLPQQLYFFIKGENLEKSKDYMVQDCILCRSCDEVCPSNIPLSQYFAYAIAKNKQNEREEQKSAKSRERFEFREYRLARNKKERDEMMARKREEAKKKLAEKQAKTAEITEENNVS